MSETKHTPGPWRVNPEWNDFNRVPVILDRRGAPVLGLDHWDEDTQAIAVSSADARLMAAAPDLLEALEQIVNELDWSMLLEVDDLPDRIAAHARLLLAADAALAQARGEW